MSKPLTIGLALLISLNSVLTLYSENFQQIPLEQVLSSAFFSLLFGIAILILLSRFIKRDAELLLLHVLCCWFLLPYTGWKEISSYIPQSVYALIGLFVFLGAFLHYKKKIGQSVGHLSYCLTAAILLCALATLLLWAFGRLNHSVFSLYLLIALVAFIYYVQQRQLPKDFLEGMAAVLIVSILIVPLINILQSPGGQLQAKRRRTHPLPDVEPEEGARDIYYIVLDGYGRADQLKKQYGYDNGPFVKRLQKRGFWVGERSHSNYMRTNLSLAATLNMNYVSQLYKAKDNWPIRAQLKSAINDSRLCQFLRQRGYTTAAFPIGLHNVEFDEADRYFDQLDNLTPFERQVWSSTLFADLLSLFTSWDTFWAHRQRFHFIWRKIPLKRLNGRPSFLLAHVVCPHPPFVFTRDGAKRHPKYGYTLFDASDVRETYGISSEQYVEGYVEQLQYLNKVLLAEVDELLKQKPTPIIILQADHGPGARTHFDDLSKTDLYERFSILNAIYLPDVKMPSLPVGFSSVNTFRLVLNECFEKQMEYLPDRSFYTPESNLSAHTEVTEKLWKRLKK